MKTKSILSEFVVLLLLSLVPLPGPPVLRAPCPRDRSAVVRSIVHKKWLPILEKYGLKLPIECPFHPLRDIFWPRQFAKIRHRPSQWSCGLCGKSFYSERYLEQHFENRHPDHLNLAEDAVCLADYCDVMRCGVWEAAAMSKAAGGQANTDLELWKETSALIVSNGLSDPSPTALQSVPSASRGDIATFNSNNVGGSSKSEKNKQRTTGPHCTSNTRAKKGAAESSLDGENSTLEEGAEGEGGKCPPGSSPAAAAASSLSQMQRFKADCRPEKLLPLRARCEGLVWDCLAGLLANLSTEEFKTIEGEMNRAVCWYLTCDRYWENTPNERRRFPWALLLALVTALALVICLCYYLIWLMCDSDDQGMGRENSMSQPSSPSLHARGLYPDEDADYYGDNMAASAQGEHYIYVTYPPELKRRLMESCYNRTTRL